MQPIAFCSRCRGMKVGWNRPYVAPLSDLHGVGVSVV